MNGEARTTTTVGHLLPALVRDEPTAAFRATLVSLLRRPSGATLVETVVAHRLTGYLLAHLGGLDDLPPDIGDRLREVRDEACATHLRALVDLAVVERSLASAGVPWLVVKGVVLSETLYPTVDLRPHQDLDVLVAPGDFRAAVDALEEAGALLLDRNWRLLREEVPGQFHLELPLGTVCDLHWDLTHRERARDALRLPADDLLARAVAVPIGGGTVLTTEPVDTLLHLASHACASGFERLIWTVDVAMLVDRVGFDWDEVAARARGTGAHLSVALALERASRQLGAAVPRSALRALDRTGLWSWLGRSGEREAAGPGWRAGLEAAVTRSTRATTWSSLRELVGRTAGWVVERVLRREVPTGEERITRATGTTADRDACLDAIEAQAQPVVGQVTLGARSALG